ncbi:MAG: Arm DNA-binding domain-containing protein [Deltaproteobacteria bacterium]|nr:Arm DNA-binding domain-containing protein [Deltaproteobacteria bacterium]
MGKKCSITDAKLRSLKPKEKPYQIYDGDGLYIEVAPCG